MFAVNGDQVFCMAGVALHSQKTVLKAATFAVFIKFLMSFLRKHIDF